MIEYIKYYSIKATWFKSFLCLAGIAFSYKVYNYICLYTVMFVVFSRVTRTGMVLKNDW